jgi:hypothetical protein
MSHSGGYRLPSSGAERGKAKIEVLGDSSGSASGDQSFKGVVLVESWYCMVCGNRR